MWELPVAIAFVAGCAGVSAWGAYRHTAARVKLFQDALVAGGLRLEGSTSPWAWWVRVRGREGPLTVRIESAREGSRVVIAIEGPPGFSEVRIRPQPSMAVQAREIEVGDEAFDYAFFVEGPVRLVSALLDAELRRLLRDVASVSGLEIGGGEIRVDLNDGQLDLLLPLLAGAGRRIAQTVDVRGRLAANAEKDPVGGVRLRNLLLLVRERPGEPDSVEALRRACTDPSPEVRLEAALELGAEGREILLELADGPVADAVSARAISNLGRELPFERTKEILPLALRRRRLKTAQACVEALGRSGEAAAVDLLAAVLEREGSRLAIAAAGALGETGDAAAEAPLLRVLEREQTEVQVAAAAALGRVGTAAAVLPLKDAADAAKLLELLRAARQAVAEIQSRLHGATPGQLSLAQSEAGQLSLAADPAGQLSISGDDDSATPADQRGAT